MSIRFLTIGICWAALGMSGAEAESPYQVASYWQLGIDIASSQPNVSLALDRDGNTFVTGTTWRDLDGPQQGLGDVFLRKYDASGAILWTKQLGTTAYDESFSVAVDASGSALVTGRTKGSLAGPNQGDFDLFLGKYDSAGIPLWTRQLGSSSYDYSYSVALDSSGNALISGTTGGSLCGPYLGGYWDAIVVKYDPTGTMLWQKQMGTGGTDSSNAVAVDAAGNVLITGKVGGPLSPPQYGGYDAFVAKYNASGTLAWAKQLGTSGDDEALAVAVDATGNSFITGRSIFPSQSSYPNDCNAFLSKLTPDGTLLWTHELGDATSTDAGYCVAVDASGDVFVSGTTSGSLGGPNLGGLDIFLQKYDAEGELLWAQQLGTSGEDVCSSLLFDAAGNLLLGGTVKTWIPFPGSHHAGYYRTDVFLYTLSPDGDPVAVPEPATMTLALAAALGLVTFQRRRRKPTAF